LLAGLDLERYPPRRARAILGGRALARAAAGPVLATGPRWVALGFDPDRSVFAASPAYPLFLRNCVLHLTQTLERPEPEYRAVGEAVPVSGVAEIAGAGAVRVDGRLQGPPGFWKINNDVYGVSLLRDLDLRGPGGASDPLADVGTPARRDRPLTAAFAAAALVFLLVAWWVFWRR
jgi:hypothetical protein